MRKFIEIAQDPFNVDEAKTITESFQRGSFNGAILGLAASSVTFFVGTLLAKQLDKHYFNSED